MSQDALWSLSTLTNPSSSHTYVLRSVTSSVSIVTLSFLTDYSLNWAGIMSEEAVMNANTELKSCTVVVCLITYELSWNLGTKNIFWQILHADFRGGKSACKRPTILIGHLKQWLRGEDMHTTILGTIHLRLSSLRMFLLLIESPACWSGSVFHSGILIYSVHGEIPLESGGHIYGV